MNRTWVVIVALLGCFFCFSVASAATWQWMGSTDTSGYYVDISSLKMSNTYSGDKMVEGWFKVEYVPPKELDNGMAVTAIKKIKYSISPSISGKIECNVNQIIYYNADDKPIYDSQTRIYPGSDFSPRSENELCFAALVDYKLGTGQLWLEKLNSNNRWLYATGSRDNMFDVWIDQYSFRASYSGKTALLYVFSYKKETGQTKKEMKYADVTNKMLDYKEVIPDTVGEGILDKVGYLIVTPTPEMVAWQQALERFRMSVNNL